MSARGAVASVTDSPSGSDGVPTMSQDLFSWAAPFFLREPQAQCLFLLGVHSKFSMLIRDKFLEVGLDWPGRQYHR